MFQSYISDPDVRSNNVNDAAEDDISVGCTLFGFGIRYQTNFLAAQPIKVEFTINGAVALIIKG